MGVLEKLVALKEEFSQNQTSDLEEMAAQISVLAEEHLGKIVKLYDQQDYEKVKQGIISMIAGLSSLIDLVFEGEEGIPLQDTLLVSTTLSFILKSAPLCLRTEEGFRATEAIALVVGKLLRKMDDIELEDNHTILLFLFVLQQIVEGLAKFRKVSFREVYYIPELTAYAQNVLKSFGAAVASKSLPIQAPEANPKKKASKTAFDSPLPQIGHIFKAFGQLYEHDENFSLIIGDSAQKLIAQIKSSWDSSRREEMPVAWAELVITLHQKQRTPLDCRNVPIVKVKEFAPKIFDKDDANSEYNVKFQQKLQKQKLRRVKSQTYREIAADAKAKNQKQAERDTQVDALRKRKLGELMRHIQTQQEEIKKEGTMNYNTPARKKVKKTRMAGNAMAKESDGGANYLD